MSWSREHTIWCDADECGEWVQASGSVADVRKYARRCGWVHRLGKDFCPGHKVMSQNEEGS